MARRDWIRVRSAWWTDPDHADLTIGARLLGPFLMWLADGDPDWRDTGVARLLDGSGTALTRSAIARRAGGERRLVSKWLDQLLSCGTLGQDADGVFFFPKYRRHQEDPAASRMRKHRDLKNSDVTVTPPVTPTVTGEVEVEVEQKQKQREEVRASPTKGRTTRPPSIDAHNAAQYLYDAIKEHTPDFIHAIAPDALERKLVGWAKDIDVGLRNDGMTLDGCKAAIDAAHRSTDDFWRSNLLSGKKLRQHYEKLRIRSNGSSGPAMDYDPDKIDYGAVEKEMKSWTTPKSPT